MSRLENRSVQEFSKDIRSASIKELDIAIRLGVYESNRAKKFIDVIPIGIDYCGNFQDKTDNSPDFIIGDNTVEITNSAYYCKNVFHQKVQKVTDALKHKYHLVFVNGYLEKEPRCVILNPNILKKMTILSIDEFGIQKMLCKNGQINKPAYRYKTSWINDLEFILPKLPKILPIKYKNLLEIAGF